MKRFMGPALLALTLGFGAPAAAQDAQLQEQAGRVLAQHGYGAVDTSMLTVDQLARLQTLEAQDLTSEGAIRQEIDQILLMDVGTATFVSEEMQALFAEPQSELRENARELLSEAGYDPALADGLELPQLAELWFLQEQPEINQPAVLQDRIQVILGDS